MATHYENAAEHLAAAMLAEPGSSDAVRETCAALMFSHAAEINPPADEQA